MARRMSTGLAARVSAFAISLMAAGCAEDSVTIRVECAILPEADDSGCEWAANGACLLEGRLNINSASYYRGTVRISNALTPRERDIPLQAETNGISISGFDVEVRNTAGDRIKFKGLPNPFFVATSAFIPVGASEVASGDFLPSAYVAQIAAAERGDAPLGQVIVAVTVRGKTQGSVDVETSPWYWPIRLFALSPNKPNCTVFDDAVCNMGQDDYVNACLDQTQEM